MKLLILAALLLVPAQALGAGDFARITETGLSQGGGTLTGNLQLRCTTCVEYAGARTVDALPYVFVLKGSDAAPVATGANQVGGALAIGGGIGSRCITVTDYTKLVGGGDTVKIIVVGTSATTTTLTAVTGAPGANQFQCATSNSVCATNLAAAIDALAGVSATASGSDVRIVADVGTLFIAPTVITDGAVDGAFAAATNGSDGPILIPSGSVSYPGLGWAADNDGSGTGLYRSSANLINVAINGTHKLQIASDAVVSYSPINLIGSGIILPQADLGATCDTTYGCRIDSGGATSELCCCTATNTWKCTALAAGPAD